MTRLLSEEQYKSALIEQNMRCAICGDHSKKQRDSFCIDHNHRTGRIRGILCSRCNSGLGFFRDSRSLLNRAERYLERYEWVGKGNPSYKMLKNRHKDSMNTKPCKSPYRQKPTGT